MATKVSITSSSPNRISINGQQRSVVRTIAVASTQIKTLSDLEDVVAPDPNNNETLVYDGTLNKYVIKTLPVVDGGSF
jgi:hypothetical protein